MLDERTPGSGNPTETDLDRSALIDSVQCAPSEDQIRADFCYNDLSNATKRTSLKFSEDSFELTRKNVVSIRSTAAILVNCPSLKIVVAGHTDARGLVAGNQRLAAHRAQAVTTALERLGVDAGQLMTASWEEPRNKCSRGSHRVRSLCNSRSRNVKLSVAR
ncbi:OmpA family protein [Nitrobacter sp.]|uniref:OmpA family protein n=1 Tax=Nitrobacter sp. TaxID=29420 RepID=UPI003F6532A3